MTTTINPPTVDAAELPGRVLALVEQFGAVADQAIALVDQAVGDDPDNRRLEDLIQTLRVDKDRGLLFNRLLVASRRSRIDTVNVLAEFVRAQHAEQVINQRHR